jgi:long-subunit acyl-CoA synthetase (AMP-forming)
MNTAKQINKYLDALLVLKFESARLAKEVDGRKKLYNQDTGEKVTKKEVLAIAEAQINEIKNDLNKITNNGKSIKGIFNNVYYINDMIQDKLIVEDNFNQNLEE